jgi:hypothetical protein
VKLDEDTPNRAVFATGKHLYVYSGIIGLNAFGDELSVSHGYDGGGIDTNLTGEEKLELAQHMLRQWTEYRARLRKLPWRVRDQHGNVVASGWSADVVDNGDGTYEAPLRGISTKPGETIEMDQPALPPETKRGCVHEAFDVNCTVKVWRTVSGERFTRCSACLRESGRS